MPDEARIAELIERAAIIGARIAAVSAVCMEHRRAKQAPGSPRMPPETVAHLAWMEEGLTMLSELGFKASGELYNAAPVSRWVPNLTAANARRDELLKAMPPRTTK